MSINKKQLAQLLAGIAKAQAAVIEAASQSTPKVKTDAQSLLGGVAGFGRPNHTTTLVSLQAELVSRALAGPMAGGQTLDAFCEQMLIKLLKP